MITAILSGAGAMLSDAVCSQLAAGHNPPQSLYCNLRLLAPIPPPPCRSSHGHKPAINSHQQVSGAGAGGICHLDMRNWENRCQEYHENRSVHTAMIGALLAPQCQNYRNRGR